MATALDVSSDPGIAPLSPPLEPAESVVSTGPLGGRHSLPGPYPLVKAWLDFTLAALLVLPAAPVILLCTLLVKLTSRGPAFYTQVRLGHRGRPYWIWKIRTMVHNAEASGPKWAAVGDARVTRVGRFLRATHLDELPQLWNILRGEMSLIGPRPERPEFIPALAGALPHYEERLLARPGVTGLAQVQLPPDSDLASVRAKLGYDLYYLRHASLWLDLRILVATVFKVFGMSFESLRAAFVFPEPEAVEQDYRDLPAGPGRVPGTLARP